MLLPTGPYGPTLSPLKGGEKLGKSIKSNISYIAVYKNINLVLNEAAESCTIDGESPVVKRKNTKSNSRVVWGT